MTRDECYIGQRVYPVATFGGTTAFSGVPGTVVAIQKHGWDVIVQFDHRVYRNSMSYGYNPAGMKLDNRGYCGNFSELNPLVEAPETIELSISTFM